VGAYTKGAECRGTKRGGQEGRDADRVSPYTTTSRRRARRHGGFICDAARRAFRRSMARFDAFGRVGMLLRATRLRVWAFRQELEVDEGHAVHMGKAHA
jgi:hypothetical protein